MHRLKFLTISTILVMILSVAGTSFDVSASPLAATAPNLGTAASFSVLAQTAITDTGTSVMSGDVGMNNTCASVTGLLPAQVGGTLFSTDGVLPCEAILPGTVQASALAAYIAIPGLPIEGIPIPGALDSVTRTPGVYDLGAGLLGGGVLTLDGPGVYIFRTSSSLTSSGSINFINGADPCYLFWRVETLATINGTSFAGTILAGTGVHFGTGVTLTGRALAIGGDVTMDNDTINVPVCIVPPGEGERPSRNAKSISGMPKTGGAPIRNEDFPWNLVIVGGFSAIALVLGVRAYRRTHLPKK